MLLPSELQKPAGSHVAMLKLKRQTLFLVTARRLVVLLQVLLTSACYLLSVAQTEHDTCNLNEYFITTLLTVTTYQMVQNHLFLIIFKKSFKDKS